MKPEISREQEIEEFYPEEVCYITEIWNTSNDPHVSIAKARLEPGKTTALHTLDGIVERYLIIEGKGLVDIEGLGGWSEVKPGDIVLIPESTSQRIRNTGDLDLVFYCICSPRFESSHYRQVGGIMPKTSTEDKSNLLNQIILNEIGGKNMAVHAYDGIIWKVRTGFLTLIFAGWGIILTGLAQKNVELPEAEPFILIMLIVSSGLSIPGSVIDINYIRRKFRVIRDLNKLLRIAPKLAAEDADSYLQDLELCMRVSGDSGDDSYKQVTGYYGAFIAGLVVYFFPLIVLWISWLFRTSIFSL